MNKILSVIGYVGLFVAAIVAIDFFLDYRIDKEVERQKLQNTLDFLNNYRK
jgi:hypothetical protein